MRLRHQIQAWGRSQPSYRHLRTIPGCGPVLASALTALVVAPEEFRSGRDFAAARGLVPRQDGSGGKVRLGPIGKRGNGDLRRLLVNGAMAVLISRRARQDPWLDRLLSSGPREVAAGALANELARVAWAVMTRREDFRTGAQAA